VLDEKDGLGVDDLAGPDHSKGFVSVDFDGFDILALRFEAAAAAGAVGLTDGRDVKVNRFGQGAGAGHDLARENEIAEAIAGFLAGFAPHAVFGIAAIEQTGHRLEKKSVMAGALGGEAELADENELAASTVDQQHRRGVAVIVDLAFEGLPRPVVAPIVEGDARQVHEALVQLVLGAKAGAGHDGGFLVRLSYRVGRRALQSMKEGPPASSPAGVHPHAGQTSRSRLKALTDARGAAISVRERLNGSGSRAIRRSFEGSTQRPHSMATKPSRPLSPHLFIYKPEATMVMSIMHRITGVGLYAGTLLLVWFLVAAASGEGAYGLFQAVAGSWFGQLVLFVFTWALFHHMLGGIRHFIWDTGHGFSRAARFGFAWGVAVGGFVLALLTFIFLVWL